MPPKCVYYSRRTIHPNKTEPRYVMKKLLPLIIILAVAAVVVSIAVPVCALVVPAV